MRRKSPMPLFITAASREAKRPPAGPDNRRDWRGALYCLAVSLIFLLLCTKSSPLYPFNDWNDANAFFTVGKGIAHGLVPYRDLFEQKGPLLYFVHTAAYLVSGRSFAGVFIFEVLFFGAFLFFVRKAFLLYLGRKTSLVLLIAVAFTVLNMPAFQHGDSAEEMCLPLLMGSLYILLKYFKTRYPEPMESRNLFAAGFMAGCVLWVKFTLLGFWIGLFSALFAAMAVSGRIGRALAGMSAALAGMLAASLPCLAYFAANGALSDLFNGYFLVNLAYYPVKMRLVLRLLNIAKCVFSGAAGNILFSVFFLAGLPAFLFMKRFRVQRALKAILVLSILALSVTVYWGGKAYPYYFFIFAPFCVFGFLVLGVFLEGRARRAFAGRGFKIALPCLILALAGLSALVSPNAYMLRWKKPDMMQYRFAAIVAGARSATLLNYGTLDCGLYTVSGIVPNVRFFEKQNIPNAAFSGLAEQKKYIRDTKTDYVLVRARPDKDPYKLNIPYLYENYRLAARQDQAFGGVDYQYLLFKSKNME
jgi:hypothetical protein